MKPLILSLACLLFLSCHKKTSAPPSGVINTVAGGGARITDINGTLATSCGIGALGVATDDFGNFYIAASWIIMKVNSSGIISIVAGRSDSSGYSGDGGPATDAKLDGASKIAVDNKGNLYIADQSNNCIRKVSPSGIISTIAGNGTPGYTGDGGLASAASLNHPWGVAVDKSGNVYVADYKNNCIRKIDVSGTISTVAGNGISGFSGDGGPAINAQLSEPAGLAVDKNGNIYVNDVNNYRIRKIDSAGTISTFAGNGPGGNYMDGSPATAISICSSTYGGVCVDADGNVYLADACTMHIRKVNPAGIITNFAGNGFTKMYSGGHIMGGYSGDGGPATNAQLDWVYDVAVDAKGNVYIADCGNRRIRKVNK